MLELVVRLVFSLAVVLGMLMLLTRLSAKRFKGGADALVRVLHRQPLSRTSAVAVVTVGSRVLVVGTTEHQVRLLAELDPEELEQPLTAPAAPAAPARSLAVVAEPEEVWEHSTLDELLRADDEGSVDPAPVDMAPVDVPQPAYSPRHASSSLGATRAAEGALAGSLLSAQTWKQAFAAATNRTRDAS